MEKDATAFVNDLRRTLRDFDKGDDGNGIVNFYNKEAERYEVLSKSWIAHGPARVADKLAELVPVGDRVGLKVLDVGAGTGNVGGELKSRGFETLHALEPSKPMIEILGAKNLYAETFCQRFSARAFNVSDGSYDAVVSCGCFIKGHLPVNALREVARILKPGGLFVTNTNQYREAGSQEYDQEIEDEMQRMEEEGVWTAISRERVYPDGYRYVTDNVLSLYAFRRN